MIRLSKLMSEKGICSRREADAYIEARAVRVNGELVTQLGTKVDPSCIIELDRGTEQKMTIALHKPIGYVSCQPEDGYRAAIELIPRRYRKGLAVAGRLDIDSTGLLILTSDGRVAKEIIGERTEVEKEYRVRVDQRPSDEDLARLRYGITLDGKPLKPAKVEWAGGRLSFVLKEGKKRQIRRMCECVGIKVIALKRVRIGNIRLGNLEPGKWRIIQWT